ncbi:MAG: hypothetical protein ACYC66_07495 [Chloroflexota bacterium]
MKIPRIQTRSGQLTWLQVLSLMVSGIFFMFGSTLPAMLMLVVATLFGVTAAIRRARDAQREHPEMFQKKRRR